MNDDQTEPNNGQVLRPLSARNAETAAMAIRDLTTKVHACLCAVQQQQKTLANVLVRLSDMENRLNLQKMQLTGLGPSVKPDEQFK